MLFLANQSKMDLLYELTEKKKNKEKRSQQIQILTRSLSSGHFLFPLFFIQSEQEVSTLRSKCEGNWRKINGTGFCNDHLIRNKG